MNIPLLIAAAVFLTGLWRPKFGLAALILLWPAYVLRTTLAGIPTTALELSLYATVVSTILVWIRRPKLWHWVQMPPGTWMLLFFWIIAWAIASIASPNHEAALGALKAWLIDPLLLCALLAFLIRTEADRRFIIQASIISGLVVALFGLYQVVWLRQTLQENRLSSFFHPVANYAAMYLTPLAVLCGGLLLYRYLRGTFWWACFGIMMLAIGLTLSYGGYESFAVGAVFLWIYLPNKKLKRWLAAGAVAVGLLTVALLSTTNNFSQHFNTTDRSSGLVRKQIWVTSWALIKDHPLFGIGPNNFESAYRTEIPNHYFPPLEWLVAQPHNLYLALWLELGALGFLAFLLPFIRHTYIVLRRLIPQAEERAVALVSLAAMITILAHGFVDTPYFKNDLAMEYMFLATLPWLGGKKTLSA